MKTCPQCGNPVTGQDIGGLCSRCVARQFMVLPTNEEASGEAHAPTSGVRDQPGRFTVALGVAGASMEREVAEGNYFVIGRSDDCELRLKDDDVSSHHARLIVRESQVWIEDLASTNGTWVGADRLTGSRPLRPDTTVRVGTTEIRFLGVRPAPPEPQQSEATAPDSRFLPRDLVGGQHFEVLGSIEQGGMGRIDEARDSRLGRIVALKRLASAPSELETERTARLVAEAQIAGQLEHPGIVPVYELGLDAQGRVFYTMRRIQGSTLADILDGLAQRKEEAVRRYPLSTLLTVFLKVCDAVAYAHSRQVIHRDLKPQNIMVGEFGEVSVLDWGLAKVSEVYEPDARAAGDVRPVMEHPVKPEVLRTLDRVIMGTPGFMAPEQAQGDTRHCDERTDIYGLGAVLYSVLTCHPPVDGKDVKEVLDQTRRGEIQPPDKRKPPSPPETTPADRLPHLPDGRVPRALAAVAMKALALNPRDRYESVTALQSDIQAYLNGFATTAELPGLLTLARLWIRRHRRAFALVLFVGVLILGFSIELFRMVTELRGTAGTFYDKAVNLVGAGRFDEALAPVNDAIRLDGRKAAYHALRGNILQSVFDMAAAAEAYAKALEREADFPFAVENRDLSMRLKPIGAAGLETNTPSLLELHQAMLLQDRNAEAIALLRRVLARDRATRDAYYQAWRRQLDAAGLEGELTISDLGRVRLDLEGAPISNASILRGMTINDLSLRGTRVTNLTPLVELPLETLNLAGIPDLTSLTVLQGLKLTRLDLSENPQIRDISPLAGMPLEYLNLWHCAQIGNLNPLRGMPLVELAVADTQVQDLTPLEGMPLRILVLNSIIRDLSPIRGLPLDQISLSGCRDLTDLSPLRATPVRSVSLDGVRALTNLIQLEGLKLTHLGVNDTPITDLGPIRDMPIATLYISGTGITNLAPLINVPLWDFELAGTAVSDLEPLRGKGLASLRLSRTPVGDLDPLRDMPLQNLFLDGCAQLHDLSVIATLKELQILTLPGVLEDTADIEFLRDMPNLRELGFEHTKPTALFWQQYDRSRSGE